MEVSFIRKGEGEDLVFFHGYGSNKESFNGLINYFSAFYRVTAFDFPGFGKSGEIDKAYSVGDYADVTSEFLLSQGITRPNVIAHSFGARVAVKMAARADCFKNIVITGGAGIINNRGFAYRIKVFSYRVVKRFSAAYANARFGSSEYRNLSPVMKESYKKIVNEDLRFESSKIKCRVLLVYGAKDKVTPPSEGKIYSEFIPNGRLIIMNNCGHFAFIDDPIGFRILTEEFLNNYGRDF